MAKRISITHFSGLAKIHRVDGDGLGPIIRSMAQTLGRVAASNITDLTDSSGGTPASSIGAIALPTGVTVSGTNLAPKAGWDTQMAAVRNGIATLAAQVNAINARLPAGSVVDSTGGTSGGSTVAAISATLTAVDGSGNGALDVVSAAAQVLAYRDALSELTVAVNKIAIATGKTELADLSGGKPAYTAALKALAASSGAGVAGTANGGVANTQAQTILASLRNAVASLAAKLNEATGSSASDLTVDVVAA